jgi:hypothetical protein
VVQTDTTIVDSQAKYNLACKKTPSLGPLGTPNYACETRKSDTSSDAFQSAKAIKRGDKGWAGLTEEIRGQRDSARETMDKLALDPEQKDSLKARLKDWGIFGRFDFSKAEAKDFQWSYSGIQGSGEHTVYDPYTGTLMKFETQEEAEYAETWIQERRASDLLLASSLSPRAVESVLKITKIENPQSQAAIDLNLKLEADLHAAVSSEAKSMSTSELMYFASQYPGNAGVNAALQERFSKLKEQNISLQGGLNLNETDLRDQVTRAESRSPRKRDPSPRPLGNSSGIITPETGNPHNRPGTGHLLDALF